MSVVSWRSSVRADELGFDVVEGDRITVHGDAGPGSWSGTERVNLPPAVETGRTYRHVRVDLTVEVELGAPSPGPG